MLSRNLTAAFLVPFSRNLRPIVNARDDADNTIATSKSLISMRSYEPRHTCYLEQWSRDFWQLKTYALWPHGDVFQRDAFEPGIALVTDVLPSDSIVGERPGVGFMLLHQASVANYVVLGWWDRENELPVHVGLIEKPNGGDWRMAKREESFCVWDLNVIWHERNAYVASYLNDTCGKPQETYLADVLNTEPDRLL